MSLSTCRWPPLSACGLWGSVRISVSGRCCNTENGRSRGAACTSVGAAAGRETAEKQKQQEHPETNEKKLWGIANVGRYSENMDGDWAGKMVGEGGRRY